MIVVRIVLEVIKNDRHRDNLYAGLAGASSDQGRNRVQRANTRARRCLALSGEQLALHRRMWTGSRCIGALIAGQLKAARLSGAKGAAT